FQYIRRRSNAIILNPIAKYCLVVIDKRREKSLAAPFYVVLKNVDAVNTGYGKNRVPFVLELAFAVSSPNDHQFLIQNLSEEISRSASWLKKARFYSIGLVSNQCQHLLHDGLRRVYFAVIGYT